MKKKTLLLALSLVAGMGAQAQPYATSPWVGNPAPEESGTYYLYNVESGYWLQNNHRNPVFWTTYASVDVHGFDIEVVPLEDGTYRLNPKFGHNLSINGWDDYGYMDTGREITHWTFMPSSVVENGYEIMTVDPNNSDTYHMLNVNEDYDIDDFGVYGTWQLVSKAERLADLAKATKANPKDATWLIGWWDFANQDDRQAAWERKFEGGNNVTGGDGDDAEGNFFRCNRAFESWNSKSIDMKQVITNIPNGTYELRVQGFYRDSHESEIGAKFLSGEETIRSFYYANDVSKPFMSICAGGSTEQDVTSFHVPQGGVYIPGNTLGGNALLRAAKCFWQGGYWNEPIRVVVADNTLTIGIRKEEGVEDDWTVFDNFNLTYLGSDVDIDEVLENLQKAIAEAETYEGNATAALTAAIATGKATLSSTDAATIVNATTNIQASLSATKAMNAALAGAAEATAGVEGWVPPFLTSALEAANAKLSTEIADTLAAAAVVLQNAVNDASAAITNYGFFQATVPFAQAEGVAASIISATQEQATNAASLADVNNALNTLRIQRKLVHVETQADVFEGNEPESDKEYYLYNVGTHRFLCGGDDWGAHAAVGFPGVEVTLVAYEAGVDSFIINTHLNNGTNNEGIEREYLNYGGYMDTDGMDPWCFKPVEGKPGVYNLTRRGATDEETGETEDIMLGYQAGAYCVVQTDMKGHDDPNNQWKLVTRADREDLLYAEDVDEEHPVDATFYISCPNFNQREDYSAWLSENGSIWGRGNNYPDFAYECWNEPSFDLNQDVLDLPVGWYTVSCTGYYRDGDHENQIRVIAADGEPVRAAAMYAEDADEQLPNITAGIDKVPGMGARHTTRALIQATDDEGNPLYNEDGTPQMIEDPDGEPLYIGEFPYYVSQAVNWFQLGYYKTKILTEVTGAQGLMIGIEKYREDVPRDWVVVDNFRLTYYGVEKPVAVKDILDNNDTRNQGDNKVYNLQGIQMKDTQKGGLYIRNGKKFIVK